LPVGHTEIRVIVGNGRVTYKVGVLWEVGTVLTDWFL